MKISIINYGMGNLGSVITAITNLGFKAEICNSPSNLDEADKIILPGVGSFSDAMKCLKEENWLPVINNHVADKERPLLGICLGMQLLAEYGTEGGEVKGLGYIPGNVKHLEKLGCKQRIPHVGWNNVNIVEESMLYNGISSGHDFILSTVTPSIHPIKKIYLQRSHIPMKSLHPFKKIIFLVLNFIRKKVLKRDYVSLKTFY